MMMRAQRAITITLIIIVIIMALRPVQCFLSMLCVGVVCAKNSSAACHSLL
eukprot:COSAG06_NODE_2784_length_6289_cov_6.795153_2_plen_51_part_00